MTTAVGLLVLAALVVAGAALSGSWLLVTIAAGLGVVLGAAATRITHTELVESRVRPRTTAPPRRWPTTCSPTSGRRSTRRTSTTCGPGSPRRSRRSTSSSSPCRSSQRRAATSTRKRNAEGRRAAGLQVRLSEAEERAAIAQLRVVELEQEVLALRAELETVTAAWQARSTQRKHA